jgi:hypothetical protein
MTIGEFAPMVGQTLLADCSPKPVEITLVSAQPLTNYAGLERPPFVLVFRTPPEVLLVMGTYAMRCGEWGPDLIYIEQMSSPTPGDTAHYYQAVFN